MLMTASSSTRLCRSPPHVAVLWYTLVIDSQQLFLISVLSTLLDLPPSDIGEFHTLCHWKACDEFQL